MANCLVGTVLFIPRLKYTHNKFSIKTGIYIDLLIWLEKQIIA
jgi:hypothetical protein